MTMAGNTNLNFEEVKRLKHEFSSHSSFHKAAVEKQLSMAAFPQLLASQSLHFTFTRCVSEAKKWAT